MGMEGRLVGNGGTAGADEEGELEEKKIKYELERSAIIEENKRRMLELGLLNLKAELSPPRVAKRKLTHVPSPGGVRRSSRLQGTPSVTYYQKKDKDLSEEGEGRKRVKLIEGTQPEIYTDKDEKLLGSYEKPWQLFVDGCHEKGMRIYDSSAGKTCHQCRQKTLGLRTSCSFCKTKQGQFCGDCLFMRYGENVSEVLEKKKWKCPVCRGICNCSFCRPKRGWAPTGALYRKVIALGYKSVAHYLIYTRRAIPIIPID